MSTYRVVDEDGDWYETEGDPGEVLANIKMRFHRYADLSAQALARDLTSLLNRAKDLGIAVCPDVDSDGISYSIEWAYGDIRRGLDVEYSRAEKRWLCSSEQPTETEES